MEAKEIDLSQYPAYLFSYLRHFTGTGESISVTQNLPVPNMAMTIEGNHVSDKPVQLTKVACLITILWNQSQKDMFALAHGPNIKSDKGGSIISVGLHLIL